MNVSVLGCGRWGTFLASYHCAKSEVLLWGRPGSKSLAALREKRANEYQPLPEKLRLTDDLAAALAFAPVVVVSISAQQLRAFARRLAGYDVKGKTFILCMKGLEAGTGKRLTQVFREEVAQPVDLAVWVGPGHVQDFAAGVPNCMVVDSADPAVTDRLVSAFGSELIRLYKGRDLLGTEVGAAAKNVVGIAAGMLDGAGCSSLKGALMARGAREVARLIRAMGGSELSAYGLCHLGDYQATLFSPHSHNRRFGESFIKGEPFDKLAEGAATVQAMTRLGRRFGVELPICQTVEDLLYNGLPVGEALPRLFARTAKGEFDY